MNNNKGNGVSEENRQLNGKANAPEEKAVASRRTPKRIGEGRAKARLYIGPTAMSGVNPIVKSKELDAGELWKLVEDVVVPRLRLSVIDHVVYSHLLRHSRLEGRRRLKFSIPWLAHNINLSTGPTREAVRRLARQGALRLLERSKAGHVVEVRWPEEIPGVRAKAARAREAERQAGPIDIESVDFMKTLELRRAIHARERGRCFYCLRRITPRLECLDHVVPRARVGCNSYRNLVSACIECNSQKGEKPAEEFLRWLFREHRLGAAELRGRFEALEMLAAGKLRPELSSRATDKGNGES
jgi:HNH endonuclease